MSNKRVADPILLSVLDRAMVGVTREMGESLLRTTRSPIFNESRDFVTGIYDAEGRMLAQTEYIPVQAFSIPVGLKAVVDFFRGQVSQGDIFIHNDVYSGGNQNQDISVFKPIFYQEELVAWAATKGHHVDVGGSGTGGYDPQVKDIWGETIRITPLKIVEAGHLREDLWHFLIHNTRLPEVVEGDLRAQMGSCTVGEERLIELINRYEKRRWQEGLEALLDSTERWMRQEISQIPKGKYYGESAIDDDGVTPDKRYRTRLTVTVDEDGILFDFTGTDPQAPSYVNSPYATTVSVTVLAFLMLVDPRIPHNDGIMRPLGFRIPEGTILNPRFPAPAAHGNFTANDTIPDAMFKALAPAIPQRVTAGWQRIVGGPIVGIDPRTNRLYVDITFLSLKGGSGAAYGADGWGHVGLICCAGGVRSQDYEMHERQDPHLLIKHEYCCDSAGAGQWRGGLGVHTLFRIYSQDAVMNMHSDGMTEENAPFGLFGGLPGKPNRCYFHLPDGQTIQSVGKKNYPLPTGATLEVFAGGGGGYGNPYLREAEAVQRDVINGVVSLEAARGDYGVVIDPRTWAIHWEETMALRAGKGKSDGS